MSGTIENYNYQKAKDYIKWMDLKPKDYIPIIDVMFASFKSNLPSK